MLFSSSLAIAPGLRRVGPLSSQLIHSFFMRKEVSQNPPHGTKGSVQPAATCNLQPAGAAAAAAAALLPCDTVPTPRLHMYFAAALQRTVGTLQPTAGATQRTDTFFFFVEMRSGIAIWFGVMGAAGSPPLTLSIYLFSPPPMSPPRLRAAAAGSGRWGQG